MQSSDERYNLLWGCHVEWQFRDNGKHVVSENCIMNVNGAYGNWLEHLIFYAHEATNGDIAWNMSFMPWTKKHTCQYMINLSFDTTGTCYKVMQIFITILHTLGGNFLIWVSLS